jgi:D-arabinose 1-dehydrogenase-like Zn-dependent alcohol dehydrogenase
MDGYLSLLKARGVMSCVGIPDKAEPTTLFMHSCVPSEKSIVGSYLGPYADYQEMLQFSADNAIAPMVEVVPFAEVNAAVEKVKDGSARYRMVLEM